VSEGSPPQRPPQVSPDGKWVWDGTEWQPVAGRDSGHTAVFPAFNPAALQASMVDPTPAATPFGAAPPVVNYAASYSAPQQTSAPLWQVKPGHWNKYLYVVAGVVVLVIAGIFLSSLGPISLPWFGGSGQTGNQAPAPSLLSKRSDYEASSQFVTTDMVSPLQDLNGAVQSQLESCNGILSVGCQSAMVETDNRVLTAHSKIISSPAPVCIAPNVHKMKFDLEVLDVFLHQGLKGFSDNSKFELVQAIAGFNAAYKVLQADTLAAYKAQNSFCDTQLTGP
jgi:hypothetical protein